MEQQILAVVRSIYRDTGCNVKTLAVAQRLYVHPATARRWLVRLESDNQITRIGHKCGWLPKDELCA